MPNNVLGISTVKIGGTPPFIEKTMENFSNDVCKTHIKYRSQGVIQPRRAPCGTTIATPKKSKHTPIRVYKTVIFFVIKVV
jgi:hypothetical protein